jgi:hypothetical protein
VLGGPYVDDSLVIPNVAQCLEAPKLPLAAFRGIDGADFETTVYRRRLGVDEFDRGCYGAESPLDRFRREAFPLDVPPERHNPLGGNVDVRIGLELTGWLELIIRSWQGYLTSTISNSLITPG